MKRNSRRFIAKAMPTREVVLVAWLRYEEYEAPLHRCEGCQQDQADFAYVWYEEVIEGEPFALRFERTLAEQQARGPVEHDKQYFCAYCAFAIVQRYGHEEAALRIAYATGLLGRGVGATFYRISTRPAGAIFGLSGIEDTLTDVYKRRFEAAAHGPMQAQIGVKHD